MSIVLRDLFSCHPVPSTYIPLCDKKKKKRIVRRLFNFSQPQPSKKGSWGK